MTVDEIFGNTLFDKATEGIAKRVILVGTISATEKLIQTFRDINDGIDMADSMAADDPLYPDVLKEAFIDLNKANKELIALSNMLEERMGISA